MTVTATRTMNGLSIGATLVDAALAFARGRDVDGLLLLVAAALSTRVPGLGAAASVVLRLLRRLR